MRFDLMRLVSWYRALFHLCQYVQVELQQKMLYLEYAHHQMRHMIYSIVVHAFLLCGSIDTQQHKFQTVIPRLIAETPSISSPLMMITQIYSLPKWWPWQLTKQPLAFYFLFYFILLQMSLTRTGSAKLRYGQSLRPSGCWDIATPPASLERNCGQFYPQTSRVLQILGHWQLLGRNAEDCQGISSYHRAGPCPANVILQLDWLC